MDFSEFPACLIVYLMHLHSSEYNIGQGKLLNGQDIAVKRLSKTWHQGQAEMKNEVALVAKLQHKNLVRLLSYCIGNHERLLVYEFLATKAWTKSFMVVHFIQKNHFPTVVPFQ